VIPSRDYRSYSQLDTFMQCAEQYRLKYRVGIPEAPAWWLVGGSAFHLVTEYIDHHLDDCTSESIEDAWWAAWSAELDIARSSNDPQVRWRAANKGIEGESWWECAGLDMAHNYWRWRQQRTDLTVLDLADVGLMVEHEMQPELSGIPLKMTPDRVMVDSFGQLLVMDYKTGSRPPKSSLQLGVYKVGLELMLGLSVEWGAYYMARKPELLPPQPLSHWTPDRIGSMFATMDAQERAGLYLPHMGEHCNKICGVRRYCQYWGGERHPLEDEDA
jgi:hypothetical protein